MQLALALSQSEAEAQEQKRHGGIAKQINRPKEEIAPQGQQVVREKELLINDCVESVFFFKDCLHIYPRRAQLNNNTYKRE